MHLLAAASALNVLDPGTLPANLCAFGVFLALFAETGLLVGSFLPGDPLLFTAGLLCSTPVPGIVPSLSVVLGAGAAGALLGAQVGYLFGRRAGPALLDRPDPPALQQAVARASAVLKRYGAPRAILLARFIPLVRTGLNPLAGTVQVPIRVFTVWQAVGGLLWAVGVTLAGYVLGTSIPNVDQYLLQIIAVVVLLSLIPVALALRGAQGGASPRRPTAAGTR